VAIEENRPMTSREVGTELFMQLSEPLLELVNVFKEQTETLYIFFS
jgi:hypothetical protein